MRLEIQQKVTDLRPRFRHDRRSFQSIALANLWELELFQLPHSIIHFHLHCFVIRDDRRRDRLPSVPKRLYNLALLF